MCAVIRKTQRWNAKKRSYLNHLPAAATSNLKVCYRTLIHVATLAQALQLVDRFRSAGCSSSVQDPALNSDLPKHKRLNLQGGLRSSHRYSCVVFKSSKNSHMLGEKYEPTILWVQEKVFLSVLKIVRDIKSWPCLPEFSAPCQLRNESKCASEMWNVRMKDLAFVLFHVDIAGVRQYLIRNSNWKTF